MAYSLIQRGRMADIFNDAIKSSLLNDISVTATDFDPDEGFLGVPLIKFLDGKDPIPKLFARLAQNRQVDKGQFYHFKSVKIALSILQHRALQVSNLFSNRDNDFAEYTELFQRMGLLHQLIPTTYLADQTTINSRRDRPIDEDRDEVLILCLTKEGHKEKFWKEYANNDTGVCLVLRFEDFVRPAAHTYDFRDVYYDKGYDFEFINKVNHHFSQEFGRLLFIDGLTKFARCYKRNRYNWENETRLVFDYHKSATSQEFLRKTFKLEVDGDRKYITLPLKGSTPNNPLFTITIDELIVGQQVSSSDFDDLKKILHAGYPQARIWQREYSNY
jgi:hypothetical protein